MNSKESRPPYSSSKESRPPYISSSEKKPVYNSIAAVDELIQELEASAEVKSDSPAVNKALEAKRKQLSELKELVAQAKKDEEEKRLLKAIERDSARLSKAISGLKERKR